MKCECCDKETDAEVCEPYCIPCGLHIESIEKKARDEGCDCPAPAVTKIIKDLIRWETLKDVEPKIRLSTAKEIINEWIALCEKYDKDPYNRMTQSIVEIMIEDQKEKFLSEGKE